MAAIGYITAYNANVGSKSSADAWEDTGVRLTAASFTANTKYLLLCTAELEASANRILNVRMTHGSTPTVFAGSTMSASPAVNGETYTYFWFGVFDQPGTTEDIDLQWYWQWDCTIRNVQLIALNLDDLQTDDWYSAVDDDTSAETALTTTFADFVSTTFTPPDNSTWLILGQVLFDVNGVLHSPEWRLRLNGTDLSINEREGEVTSEYLHQGVAANATFGASPGSQTLKIQARTEGTAAGTDDHAYSEVFALRLDAFDQFAATETVFGLSMGTANTWYEARTVSLTPNATRDFVVLGGASIYASADNARTSIRFQKDGTDITTDNSTYESGYSEDAGDFPTTFGAYVTELTSGASRTIDLDLKSDQSTTAYDRYLTVFSTELVDLSQPLTLGYLTKGATLYAPTLDFTFTLGYLNAAATLTSPQLDMNMTLGFASLAATVYAPAGIFLVQDVGPLGFVSNSATVWAVTVWESQLLVPVSDKTVGSWVTAPLWSKLDEDPDSPDGMLVTAAGGDANTHAEVNLTASASPDDTSLQHTLRIRAGSV